MMYGFAIALNLVATGSAELKRSIGPLAAQMKSDALSSLQNMPSAEDLKDPRAILRAYAVGRTFQKLSEHEVDEVYRIAILESERRNRPGMRNKLHTLNRILYNAHPDDLWPLQGKVFVESSVASQGLVFWWTDEPYVEIRGFRKKYEPRPLLSDRELSKFLRLGEAPARHQG